MSTGSPAARRPGRAVLGVSSGYHDSAAALTIDGVVVAAVQEERLTRIKGDAQLPVRSIEYVLKAGGVAPSELAAVVFYESPFAKFDRLLATKLVGRPSGLVTFVRSMASWLPDKLWVSQRLRDLLGDVQVLYCDHHLSHGWAAFGPSGFTDAAVVTVDGVGEWTTTSIGRASGSTVELLEHIEFPNSLGLLYSAFTLLCGFKINSGEYKLMGLAPYGTPRFADLIKEQVVHLEDDGSFAMNPGLFEYFDRSVTYNHRFEELFGVSTRHPDAPLTDRYLDVAASIQSVLDEAMMNLARRAAEISSSTRLCLAGGVALNVVSVGKIVRSGLFEDVFVQPAAGDAGSALGAALWATHEHLGLGRTAVTPDGMRGSLLGPSPGEVSTGDRFSVEIGADPAVTLESYNLVSERLDDEDLADRVADLLASGMLVGVAKGPMEFGPRALGSRSILADARDPGMQLRLNLSTKFREGFRPFAPVVLAEEAAAWFEMSDRDSPYMLKTYQVRSEHHVAPAPSDDLDVYKLAQQVRSTIPAVTHVDHSARVQTVDGRHPFLRLVLQRFAADTGCPVLVNTSFNVRGEPIVASAEDAIECFLHTDIDALVLEDRLILRSAQDPGSLLPRRPSARGAD